MADQVVQEVKSDRVARVAMADPEGTAVIPELVVNADRVALVGIQDPDSSSVQSCSSSCHLSSHLISILESKKRYSIWSFHACIDRKSTRLNSSHVAISYAVFCLKKKNNYRNMLMYK